MSNKIALSGVKKCGKDYCADYLVKNHGYIRLAFGDIIKDLCHKLFPNLDLDYCSADKETVVVYEHPYTGKKWTPRDIWVFINELKQVNPMIFLEMFQDKHRLLLDDINSKLVITDLRFTARKGCYYSTPELEYLSYNGFRIVYIESEDTRADMNSNMAEEFYHEIKAQSDHQFFNRKEGIEDWRFFLYEQGLCDTSQDGENNEKRSFSPDFGQRVIDSRVFDNNLHRS
jgi:hypothetical protein